MDGGADQTKKIPTEANGERGWILSYVNEWVRIKLIQGLFRV